MQIAVLVFALGAFVMSCQSGNKEVTDAARDNIQSNVTPQSPTDAQTAQPTASVPTGPTTTMTFEETTFDFGTIPDGDLVSHVYKFTNTGSEPLILSDAKGSCGCTVPKWPREPIAPGASADITVEFNSKNKAGKRNQKVTVTANTNPPQTFIYLTGEVQKAEGTADPAIGQ